MSITLYKNNSIIIINNIWSIKSENCFPSCQDTLFDYIHTYNHIYHPLNFFSHYLALMHKGLL